MIPHFESHGSRDGTPLLLLHGFPFHGAQWDAQVADLAEHHRLLVPDLRGAGRTPRGDGAVSIEFHVDDVIELLDDRGIQRVHLGGLSMGGYVALRFVDRHPDRVERLLLFDTRAEPDGNDARVARADAIRKIRMDGMQAFAEGLLPKLFPEGQQDSEACAKIRDMMRAADPAGACDALVAMASRLDLTDALPKITVPTLIVVGSEDVLTPPDAARSMSRAIPDAELVEIPGAGHISPLSHHTLVNDAIHRFLGRP
jgi:pimeloyl-ACP methyl ester carboxylesterase